MEREHIEFKPIVFSDEFISKYWEGPSNFTARQMNFLRRGFGLFNETKNYILILFGSYWTIKTMDYWMKLGLGDAWLMIGLGTIASIGIFILLLIGRWDLYRLQKATEVINARHGSVTGYQGFNMQVRMVELLEEINNKLNG